MGFSKRFIKKNILAWSLALSLLTPVYAQESTPSSSTTKSSDSYVEPPITPCEPAGESLTERYLSCIQHYTNGILKKTNMLPDYTRAALAYFESWINTKENDSSIIPALQGNFTTLNNEYTKIATGQKELQQGIVTDFFKDPTNPAGPKAIEEKDLRNANDLAYQTLLGIPYFKEDPRPPEDKVDPSKNYFINASGIGIKHVIPRIGWEPKEPIQAIRYRAYYNTVSAVQTYNAYILSQLYADYKNKFALNDVQKKLLEQVSGMKEDGKPTEGTNWLTQVGSDNLGLVLRHILLFDSQIFALMTRLLEVERQMLISQSMTNSLLMALNLGNEDTLVKKADGTLHIP